MKATPAMAIGIFSLSDILSVFLQEGGKTIGKREKEIIQVYQKKQAPMTHVAKNSSGSLSRVIEVRSRSPISMNLAVVEGPLTVREESPVGGTNELVNDR